MSRYDLEAIERRHRRASARFRGDDVRGDDGEKLSTAQIVFGGALLGLLLLALLIGLGVVAAVGTEASDERRRSR